MEDKIYRKQVFKGGLSRTGTEDGEQFRYFSAAELRDLFRLDPGEAMRSSTQRHLHALHAHQRHSTPQLDAHLDFLKTLQGFAGVSDHDLLYSTKEAEGPAAGPAAAAPASFNMTPSSKKNRPRIAGNPGGRVDGSQQQSGGNGGGTGSQGWTGCGDISAVFAKALSLGPGDNPEARPEGSGSFEHHAKIAALQAQLAKQQALLCNPVLVAGLADGGTKIKGRIAEIQATITQLQGAPPALSNRRHAAEPAPFVPPTQEVRAPPAPQLLPRPTAIAASDVADSSPDFEQPSDVTKQRVQPAATPPLSPFQRLKASLANIFTGKSPALEQGSALAPACTHADDSHAAAPEQQHSRSAVTIAPVCQSSVEEQQRLVLRRKKRELYDKALSLAAVEESGENSARAALLREEVEELNNEYQAVKAALQS